jgi:hypothetical protein
MTLLDKMMNQTSGVQLLKTRTLLAFIASIVGYGCGIDINEIRLTNTGLDVTYPEDIRRPSVALNVLQRQRIAISNMPSVVATYSHTGAVRSLHGNTRLSVVSAHELKPGASGQRLLDQFSDVLLSNHTETLIVSSNSVLRGEYRVIKLDQYIRGVPVISGGLAIGISESTGLVDSVQAAFLPDRDLAEHPSIASDDVQGLAENLLVSQMNAIQETIEIFSAPRLGYYGATREAEHQALVWIVDATYQATNGEFVSMELWIDATSGMYVGHKPTTHNILSRAVLSANNSTTLTNGLPSNMTLLFVEGDPPSGDSVANNAYNNASTVYNAWTPVGSAFSYPHMNIVVHVGVDWANAASTSIGGQEWLLFGDGARSGTFASTPFGNSLDVVAHEFGHGIVRQYGALGALHVADTRALSEFYADLSSVIADAHTRNGAVPPATWEIAEVFTNRPGVGIRSWKTPTNAVAPGARDWFPRRSMSSGEVGAYANTTIAAHAYYLLVNSGVHNRFGLAPGIPSIFVPAQGQLVTRNLFLEALQRPEMQFDPDFFDIRDATAAEGDLLHPALGEAVRTAWRAVGVGYNCTSPPPRPTLLSDDFFCAGRFTLFWDPVPTATTYHAQRVRRGSPWSLASTIVDGDTTSCQQQITQASVARLRACNGCGCSDWSFEVDMPYWSPCL